MIAYPNDFKLPTILTLAALPFVVIHWDRAACRARRKPAEAGDDSVFSEPSRDHFGMLAQRRDLPVAARLPARIAAGAGMLTGPVGVATVMRRRCGCMPTKPSR